MAYHMKKYEFGLLPDNSYKEKKPSNKSKIQMLELKLKEDIGEKSS